MVVVRAGRRAVPTRSGGPKHHLLACRNIHWKLVCKTVAYREGVSELRIDNKAAIPSKRFGPRPDLRGGW